jgi:hypothetical protein
MFRLVHRILKKLGAVIGSVLVFVLGFAIWGFLPGVALFATLAGAFEVSLPVYRAVGEGAAFAIFFLTWILLMIFAGFYVLDRVQGHVKAVATGLLDYAAQITSEKPS